MQRDAAWKGKSLTERERMTAHNLSMGGEENARTAGIIATSNGAARSGMEGSDAQKERERRRQLSEAALRAAQRIAEIDRELAGLYEERDRVNEDIRETQRRMDTLRDGIQEIEGNGDLARDEDGGLRNRALEAQLRAYERRTGRPVDRNDPEALLLALREQLDHERGAMDQHRERKRDIDSRIDRLGREREAELDTLKREHPDATPEELDAAIREADDALAWHALNSDDADADMRAAAAASFSDSFTVADVDGVDDQVALEDEYFSFADEMDPDGAAQPEPADEAPDQDRTPPENQPDTFGPQMGR